MKQGGPGRWNDKTKVLLDRFVSGIKDGNHLNNVDFELLEMRHGEIVTIINKGGYSMS